jgi:hypothetical protein
MTEIKVEFTFKRGTDTQRYTKTFYDVSINNIILLINVFATQMRDKGWQLWENRIISIREF